jgi:multidrug efflux system membrane fusion protein
MDYFYLASFSKLAQAYNEKGTYRFKTSSRHIPIDSSMTELQSSPRKPCIKLISLSLGLWLAISLTGCDQNTQQPASKQGNQPNKPAEMPAIPVKTVLPIHREVLEWDEYTGRIEAMESVDIRARVSGYLEQVLFKDGEKVKKGDLLFVIDRRNYEIDLKRAEAELQRTRTKLELAENDLKRAERLRLSKAISDEEYDQRSKGLAESTETLHSAEAAVLMAKLNLDYTEVRSPINGRIGRELITVGNLVNGDQTLLTRIVSTDPMYVYLDADERSVLKYRRLTASGERSKGNNGRIVVQLGLIDETGYPHQGYIDYVDPRMDATTGTQQVRGLFPNPVELLSPGLFARVRIHVGSPHPALLIPGRAVATDQDQKYVWVVQSDGGVDYRKITLGSQFGSFRVVSQGLAPSDNVVVDGIAKLRPGVKVKPEPTIVPYDG